MGKSVYSLVLSDELIERIDQQACQQGMSRSALINRLLAEQIGMRTPAMQMQQVFDQLWSLLTDSARYQLLPQSSESMFSVKSALRFKYNPAVRYAVELGGKQEGELGRLRVSVRTKNPELLGALERFYLAWIAMEKSFQIIGGSVDEYGHLVRVLHPGARAVGQRGASPDGDALGSAIALYIKTLDLAIKRSFEGREEALIRQLYRDYLQNSPLIL